MTQVRNLERRRGSLAEIREIMNSMKTLAYMETRKLGRFTAAQHNVVSSIEDAARDLLGFHPEILPETPETTTVYLLIGSERGFCGDFNHSLIRQLDAIPVAAGDRGPLLISVGRKLHNLLESDARLTAHIDGATTAEEITALLDPMVGKLRSLQDKHGILGVYTLHHDSADGIVMQQLLPLFERFLHQTPGFAHPPVLNQTPAELLIELADHYLFAALHETLYASLMVENLRRMTHLEGAVKQLDKTLTDLAQRSNVLRQEEIIEEIEVILLSAASLDAGLHSRSQQADRVT